MVTSVSCPMADITGESHSKMARATSSELKGQRSSAEPPPRQTINHVHPAPQGGDGQDYALLCPIALHLGRG